jgi:hypothetical protein
MTPERVAELRARYPSLTAVAELADEVERLGAELTDEIEWGIGCREGDETWYQGNYTQRGAHHHANLRGAGHFAAWRRVANWHRADEPTQEGGPT